MGHGESWQKPCGACGCPVSAASCDWAGGALLMARSFHLGTAATVITVLLGLGPSYLAWAAFRGDRSEAAVVDLDTVSEQLAGAVGRQWDEEAAVRRVNDPYPLPVAWRAADEDLAEPWPLLADLARAWPGGPPGDPGRWPQQATGLAGVGAEIGDVFTERVPTRRLVILREPGAGKSVLLIRLLQDLLERRRSASWKSGFSRLTDVSRDTRKSGAVGFRCHTAQLRSPGWQRLCSIQKSEDARCYSALHRAVDESGHQIAVYLVTARSGAAPASAGTGARGLHEFRRRTKGSDGLFFAAASSLSGCAAGLEP